jgi:hypothetical protein
VRETVTGGKKKSGNCQRLTAEWIKKKTRRLKTNTKKFRHVERKGLKNLKRALKGKVGQPGRAEFTENLFYEGLSNFD